MSQGMNECITKREVQPTHGLHDGHIYRMGNSGPEYPEEVPRKMGV